MSIDTSLKHIVDEHEVKLRTTEILFDDVDTEIQDIRAFVEAQSKSIRLAFGVLIIYSIVLIGVLATIFA